jgi:hypothetical protein
VEREDEVRCDEAECKLDWAQPCCGVWLVGNMQVEADLMISLDPSL